MRTKVMKLRISNGHVIPDDIPDNQINFPFRTYKMRLPEDIDPGDMKHEELVAIEMACLRRRTVPPYKRRELYVETKDVLVLTELIEEYGPLAILSAMSDYFNGQATGAEAIDLPTEAKEHQNVATWIKLAVDMIRKFDPAIDLSDRIIQIREHTEQATDESIATLELLLTAEIAEQKERLMQYDRPLE